MIVVDASAVVEFLFDTVAGRIISERIADPAEGIAAPALLDIEVAQAVRRWSLAGLLDEERAARAIEHLGEISALRWPHEPLLPRIWALRHNLTAYDAAYVALAEGLDAPLLTCDRSLADSPQILCAIELVGPA